MLRLRENDGRGASAMVRIWQARWPIVTALLLTLLLAVLLAIVATTPPRPRGADAPPKAFSAARAMAVVRAIAASPHPSGSSADAAVRATLRARLEAEGFAVREDRFVPDAAAYARNADWAVPGQAPPEMVNLIATRPGCDHSLPAVALMAHHDSVYGSPGAADDSAGVAAILETARALGARGTPLRDLIVVLTDGEESGLFGAQRFFAADPARGRIGALINLEARGGGGRATLFQTTPGNGAAIRLAARALGHPGGTSLAVFLYKVLPNDTDLTEALAMPPRPDFAAYNFAFIGRPRLYHSPKATPDALDQGALQDMGAQTLDLARALLNVRELPPRAPDVVFFDLFGLTLIVLPAWSGWVLLALAAAGYALLVRRGGAVQIGALAAGAGRMLALIVVVALLAHVANWFSYAPGPVNYYDRLAAIPRLELLAAAVALVGGTLVLARWQPAAGGIAGAALPLWLLAAVVQGLAPTAAYVVALPVALAGLAALAAQHARGWQVVAVLLAAIVAGYELALAHQLLQGVGPVMPGLIALPLAVLALLPLWTPLSPAARRLALVAGLVVAIATVGWVRFDALADTVPDYSRADWNARAVTRSSPASADAPRSTP